MSCLTASAPYCGDSDEFDLEDRFHVYQCSDDQYAVMDKHRYTDTDWDEDPVIDLQTILHSDIMQWYQTLTAFRAGIHLDSSYRYYDHFEIELAIARHTREYLESVTNQSARLIIMNDDEYLMIMDQHS